MGEPKGFHGSWNGIMKSMLDSFAELCPEAEIKFNTEVLDVNIEAGTLKTEEGEKEYDLILGCDGVGSIVRRSAEAQISDFKTYNFDTSRRAKSLWIRAGEEREYVDALHIYSMNPPLMATYSRGHNNDYMMAYVQQKVDFAGPEEVREHVRKLAPKIADNLEEEECWAFIKRQTLNTGRGKIANEFCLSEKVGLLGDAAHALPAVGIGCTVAMEGA